MLTTSASRSGLPGGLRERAQGIVSRLLAGQIATALALAGALALWAGPAAGYSALVGGFIAIAPSCYLAGRILRQARGATPEASLRGIYTGEMLKIVFTAALFVIAIRLLDVDFLIVVAAYAATVAVNWLALLVVDLGEARRVPPARGPAGRTN